MSAQANPRRAPQWIRRLRRYPSRRGLVAAAVILLLVVAGSVTLSVGNATTTTDAVPVESSLVAVFSKAADSCPALTPARLAGQVMAATRFVPTPQGGIGGLTAAQWKTWKPWSGASPSDPMASSLALAHLTCDLVGQVRVARIPGEPWHLALAASQSTISRMQAAGGIPSAVRAFVDRVDAYATWYADQPGLGPAGSTPANVLAQATPTLTATPTSTPTVTPTAAATQEALAAPSATAPPAAPPLDLRYDSFVDSSGLRLNGSAHLSGGRLDLAAGSNEAGSAWSTGTIDPARSFTTSFTATITNITDGVAFVIQAQSPTALGSVGGGMGYGGRPGDTALIAPSLDIELDTWDNSPDGFDPAGHQHIAVMTNGDVTQHLIWRDPGFSMWGNGPVYVWLTYDASAHVLTVYASQQSTRPAAPLFSAPINLSSIVGAGRAYVGFTGGTGLTNITDAQESILNWSFTAAAG